MTTNYSKYRMNDYEWIQSYYSSMGKEAFDEFLNRVFGRLMEMKSGHIYDITNKVQEVNRDLFIKCACLFIQSGNMDYSFNNQYTQIKKS